MTTHTIRFDADVPVGWSSVDPAQFGSGNASAVFVRTADHYTHQTPVIVITEHLLPSSDIDLNEFAFEYAERKRASTIALEITRSGYITKESPAEFGQDMQFILVSGAAVKLTHMTIATPTTEGKTHILEITFSASTQQYSSCSSEFAEFLKSLRVVTG
ncbi:hypothetical protein [Mycolicibacterium wolinskyi]|uniref:hypothetical protein n=1 Tax=Mycolicibacterium wolinskyi TaxID=59750 RepID=UPI003917AAD4